ncbi:MAG TPA: tetratricopeptide repeat protein [Vicinamibacterales bacterium]
MKRESIVFAVAGMFFGLLAGWLIASQYAATRPAAAAAAAPAAPAADAAPTQTPARRPAPPPDEAAIARFEEQATREPQNAEPRINLGNLYFDAERYADAARWYEAALALDPRNADVSTDLGVSYYYLNQPDRALRQFERSLEIDPRHTKTMLNVGIVRAFGKQDLEGATRAWERVVALAPSSPEGQAARRALEAVKAAHPDVQGGAANGSR